MNIVKAYVDGSYDKKKKIGGFGIVYLDENDNIISLDSGTIKNKPILSMWNVAGEITAATIVLEKCLYEKIPDITIYYDYEGIEKWARKLWQCKNEYTKEYRENCQRIFKDVNVRYIHVKGHSGDKYNEMADILAKIGAGICESQDSIDNITIHKYRKEGDVALL